MLRSTAVAHIQSKNRQLAAHDKPKGIGNLGSILLSHAKFPENFLHASNNPIRQVESHFPLYLPLNDDKSV
jgi:hypothetical protein